MRYGFIGTGNMASALIKGMLQNGFNSGNFICHDINRLQAENFCNENGISFTDDYAKLIRQSDCIVLSVKPNIFEKLLPQIAHDLQEQSGCAACSKNAAEITHPAASKMPLIISIAAGKKISDIETWLGCRTAIARAMPNMNASVNAAMTALCFNDLVSEEHKKIARDCFQAVGACIEIEEPSFSIFSAIAGCSPAFTYMYIDSLAKAAHRAGMKKQDALRVAAQSVMGSAKMLLSSDEHPDALADKVCSPGGTTIEGVCSLEENGFRSTVIKAVEAAYQKDLTLI